MKAMKKLWIEAQSYYFPIWQWPLPAKTLTKHYCEKKKENDALARRLGV